MCGIVGYTGESDACDVVLNGLQRLEYRGYDSAGIATVSDNPGLSVAKAVGDIDEMVDTIDTSRLKGTRGIGHTRWATHGGVTQTNAHPHTSQDGRIAVVHNGIIENHDEFRESIKAECESETDTEVIAHFIREKLTEGRSHEEAIRSFMEKAEGTFAVVVIDEETNQLYAMRKKSPLAIGIGSEGQYVASDIYAFADHTDRAIFLEDDEYAIVGPERVEIYTKEGEPVTREPESFSWGNAGGERGDYDHYMIKEIHEQPRAIKRLERSMEGQQQEQLKAFAERVKEAERVIFTAAGSSYHASLLGVYYLQEAGIEAQALIASEFQNYERVDEDTLVVAVSQSGETMDVIEAIEYSKDHGSDIASIVNVPYSTIQRESDISLEIKAGQEICVAATKTFTNQVVTMLHLANAVGAEIELGDVAERLNNVISSNEDRASNMATDLTSADDLYVLGRGPSYPIAREIALKLKEIPYIHAEGMMGGELKHGTLALIEEGTPVLSLVSGDDDRILSNVEEVEARGAKSIRLSPVFDAFEIPDDDLFALYATTVGFLLSYYIAKEKGLPIDKPRNLAKSVTVT